MIEVLSKSDNPKHRNSKFLKFLKKLAQGSYTIENEQLVKKEDKLAEFRVMEQERLKEEEIRQQEEAKKKVEERTKLFDKLWNSEEELDEAQCKEYHIKHNHILI